MSVLKLDNILLHGNREAFLEVRRGEKVLIKCSSRLMERQLVRILTGLEESVQGNLFFGDSNLDAPERWLEYKKSVNYVNAKGALISNMTLEENMIFPSMYHTFSGRIIPLQELEVKVNKLCEELDIHNVDILRPDDASSLYRIKTSFARGFLSGAGLFLLDNILSNLNKQEKGSFFEIFEKISATLTVIAFDRSGGFPDKLFSRTVEI